MNRSSCPEPGTRSTAAGRQLGLPHREAKKKNGNRPMCQMTNPFCLKFKVCYGKATLHWSYITWKIMHLSVLSFGLEWLFLLGFIYFHHWVALLLNWNEITHRDPLSARPCALIGCNQSTGVYYWLRVCSFLRHSFSGFSFHVVGAENVWTESWIWVETLFLLNRLPVLQMEFFLEVATYKHLTPAEKYQLLMYVH